MSAWRPANCAGRQRAVLRTSDSRLYRQHQLQLEIGTYRNDAFKPDWYPDPLIPFEAPGDWKEAGGARVLSPSPSICRRTRLMVSGWTFTCPPTRAPGEYRGVYRVTAEGGTSLDVPVVLTVWDFTLPRTPTLVTAFGSPAQRMRDYYRQRAKGGQGAGAVGLGRRSRRSAPSCSASIASMPRRRAEMLRPVAQPDGSFQIPAEQVQALREFVDRYHVNALDIPHPSSVIKDPEAERDKLRAWLAAFDRAAKELDRPSIVFYTYLKDEPNTLEDYDYVQKWGRAIREAKSVVKVLVVEQTWTEPGKGGADSAWGDLYGAVDIWCPLFSLHRPETRRQAPGPGRDDLDLHGAVPGTAHALVAHRFPAAQLPRAGLDGLARSHEGPALLGRHVLLARDGRSRGCTRPSTPAGACLSRATRASRSTAKARSSIRPRRGLRRHRADHTPQGPARRASKTTSIWPSSSRLGKSAEADKIVQPADGIVVPVGQRPEQPTRKRELR